MLLPFKFVVQLTTKGTARRFHAIGGDGGERAVIESKARFQSLRWRVAFHACTRVKTTAGHSATNAEDEDIAGYYIGAVECWPPIGLCFFFFLHIPWAPATNEFCATNRLTLYAILPRRRRNAIEVRLLRGFPVFKTRFGRSPAILAGHTGLHMDKELSEQLQALRDAITEAMWNSGAVLKAMDVLRRCGSDVQIELNVVSVSLEPSLEVGSTAVEVDGGEFSPKLILNSADSNFLR